MTQRWRGSRPIAPSAEPHAHVAGQYDFWHWAGHIIPLRNFRDWFLLSALLQLLFLRADFPKRNPLVPLVYLVQLLFFFVLGLLAGK